VRFVVTISSNALNKATAYLIAGRATETTTVATRQTNNSVVGIIPATIYVGVPRMCFSRVAITCSHYNISGCWYRLVA